MKTSNFKCVTRAAMVFVLAGIIQVAQAATSIKANVNGMVCAFCAQGIEKRLLRLPATQEVFVDLKKRVVAIQLKDGATLDPKQVSTEIVEAGYDVTKIELVSQSVADIRAETKNRK